MTEHVQSLLSDVPGRLRGPVAPCGCQLLAAQLCDTALDLWDRYCDTRRLGEAAHDQARAAYRDHILAAHEATR